MPIISNNDLSASGLTVNSTSDIVNNLTLAFQAIYGSQINVSANSPDGQLIQILAQAIQDNLQLLTQVYASFGIDAAYGVILDQRVALSGIIRNQGTYTTCFVAVTATQALTLPGSDVLAANPNAIVFTVSDTAGNQYTLNTSYVFGSAGTASLEFTAVTLGPIQTTPNTITTIVTFFTGVASVNNPSTSSDIQGLAEETDPQLKIRQANSYLLQAVGPADAIRAAILNIPAADCFVAENDTGSTNLGVPAHGIWVIVSAGGATAAQIGNAIYAKKGIGAAMTGAQSYVVTRPQGNTFTALWDNAISETLYIQATLYPKIAGTLFDVTADGIALAAALTYKLGQSPVTGDVANAMALIEPTASLGNIQISSNGSVWQQIVTPSDFQHYFVLTAARVMLSNS